MRRFNFDVKGNVLIVNDLISEGSLRICCKPVAKPEVSPVYAAWNDLECSIEHGDLILSLHGLNTITESRGFNLRGGVSLTSSHLFDPTIYDSQLYMTSIRSRSAIMNSNLSFIGVSNFGNITFNECEMKTTPEVTPHRKQRDVVYYQNRLI